MTNPFPWGRRRISRVLPARPLACCLLLATALVLAAVACSNSTTDDTSTTGPPTTVTLTTGAAASATPAPSLDDVLAKLQTAGATAPATTTVDDDPNDLLGRPNGYSARATFALPGGGSTAKRSSTDRGGSVEIWPGDAAASARTKYVLDALKQNPALGTEYHYLAGGVLVRVTGKVKPADAAKIEAAVKALSGPAGVGR